MYKLLLPSLYHIALIGTYLVHTNFTSNSLAAFTAPVTEVAFFTAPEAKREQAQAVIENMIVSSTDPIITVGKASGGAVGWGTFASYSLP